MVWILHSSGINVLSVGEGPNLGTAFRVLPSPGEI